MSYASSGWPLPDSQKTSSEVVGPVHSISRELLGALGARNPKQVAGEYYHTRATFPIPSRDPSFQETIKNPGKKLVLKRDKESPPRTRLPSTRSRPARTARPRHGRCMEGDDGNYGSTALQDVPGGREGGGSTPYEKQGGYASMF